MMVVVVWLPLVLLEIPFLWKWNRLVVHCSKKRFYCIVLISSHKVVVMVRPFVPVAYYCYYNTLLWLRKWDLI